MAKKILLNKDMDCSTLEKNLLKKYTLQQINGEKTW